MSAATLYSVIDVSPDADEQAVKKAVRRALRETHPDMNDGRTSERYHAVQEAADTLLDPSSRASYDRDLGIGSPSAQADEPTTAARTSSRTRRAAQQAKKRHPTGRTFDHDVPVVGVRPRFTAPGDEAQMWPKPNHGAHGRVVSIVIGSLMAVSGLALLVTTWMHGAPLETLGAVETAGQLLGQAMRTVMVLILMLVAGLGLIRAPRPGRLIAVGGVFAALVVVTSSGPAEFVPAVTMAVAGLACVIGFPSRDRLRSGHYLVDPATAMSGFSYGVPGTGLAEAGFGSQATNAGIMGERATAELLEKHISRFRGARAFHSMRFAPDSDADVDHVVVYGDKIALIDSKLWPSAAYEWESGITAEIVEYNPKGTRRTRTTTMPEARKSYAKLFPGYEVQVWILIHPAGGAKGFSIDDSAHPNAVHLGDADSVINDVGAWLAKNETVPPVDRKMLNQLALLLKN
jgi:hypothetical protein